MKVPLFSEKEQAQFFKVIREINRHLHHTKQYDKAEEVLKQLEGFKEQIKALAPKVNELFDFAFSKPKYKKDSKKQEHNKYECLRNCINNFLRSRMPFDDQLAGIMSMWDEGKYTFFHENEDVDKSDRKYSYRKKEERKIGKKTITVYPLDREAKVHHKGLSIEEWVREVFSEVRNIRLKTVDITQIIITKLVEIQGERETYQILLNETLKERNGIIYGKIKEVKKALFHLREDKIDALFSQKIYDEEHLQYVSDFIEAINTLKVALNDLYIEKNKLRGFVPFYPAFRAELFKKRAESVRRPLERNAKVRRGETINELKNIEVRFKGYRKADELVLSGWLKGIKKINSGIQKSSLISNIEKLEKSLKTLDEDKIIEIIPKLSRNIGKVKEKVGDESIYGLDESKKMCVKARLNRIVYNLSFNDKAFKRFGEDLKVLMEKLENYDSNLDKSWENLVEKAFHIKQSTDGKSNKEDLDNPYIQLNIIAENANFDAILEHLNILRQRFINVITYDETGFKYDLDDETLSNQFIERKIHEVFSSQKNTFAHFFGKNLHKIRDNKNTNVELETIKFKLGINTLVNETQYFFNCVKGHLKKMNSRVHSRIPTEYEPFSLGNDTLKNLLKNEKHRFSSKFRNLMYKFDNFLEEGFEKVILEYKEGNSTLEPFDKLQRDFQQQLEEVAVGRYNVLNQFLHSNSFAEVSDNLQIYGASFGIWNQVTRQLVRFQDKRYMNSEFRPSKSDPLSKWFDLPERLFNGETWKTNPYEESIDLMYLSRRNQVAPQFLEQFGQQNNLLNLVEKGEGFLFCEDGEISAFSLLYRMLNSFSHTFVSLETIESLLYQKGKEGDISTKALIKNYKKFITKRYGEEALNYNFPIISPITFLLFEIYDREKKLNHKKFITYPNSFIKNSLFRQRQRDFNFLNVLLENILNKEYSDKTADGNKKREGEGIKFDKKEIEDRDIIDELAYDKVEAKARIEKFYNELEVRISNNLNNYSQELYTQGLITDAVGEEADFVDVSERYINLCRFIIKEIKPNSYVGLKVRSDFDERYLRPENQQKYLIDKRLARYEETNFENFKILDKEFAKKIATEREIYLEHIQNELGRVANQNKIHTISKQVFYKQLSSILSLLLESVAKFLTDKNSFQTELSKWILAKNTENLKEDNQINTAWKLLKKYIDRLSKFSISANFLWRAKNSYALSQLVIPMASTSVTKASISDVGFLIIGIRNIYKKADGEFVHITYDTPDYLKELIFSIRSVFSPLMQPLMDKVFYGAIVTKGIEEDAKLAAASQVMARNLSHNMGSHVLATLGNGENLTDNILELLLNRGEEDSRTNRYKVITDLLNYIRERMDLIADISTSAPQFTTTKHLESVLREKATSSDVYDESANIENITNQSNYEYPKYGTAELIFKLITGIENQERSLVDFIFDIEDNLYVSFAHDNLGVQAFFVIVENIIRNAFKHDVRRIEKLGLKIASGKIHSNYVPIMLTLIPSYNEDKNETGEPIEQVVEKIDSIIKSSMLEEKTGRLRLNNWGLLEMKLAASYLRRQDIIKIDNEYIPPLLKVEPCQNVKHLCYTIYLETPKTLLCIIEDKSNIRKETIQSINEQYGAKGIKVISLEEFKKSAEFGQIKENNIPETNYDFLAIQQGSTIPISYSPYQRVISLDELVGSIGDNNLISSFNDDKWQIKLWEKWISSFSSNESYISPNIQIIKPDDRVVFLEDSKRVNINNKTHELYNLALFDDHEKKLNTVLNSKYRPLFYTAFHSSFNNYTNKIIAEYDKNRNDSVMRCKLTEMINYSIAVIDERVQLFALKDKEAQVYDALQLSGVHVIDVKLNEKLVHKDNQQIIDWVKKTKADNNNKLDVLIIHVGIIEMLYESTNDCISRFEEDIRKVGDFFIIYTSGRGLPSRVPNGSYFLSNSTVLKYLFPLDKLSLVNVIYSLRMVQRKSKV